MKTHRYWKQVTNLEPLKKQFTPIADKIALMWLYVTEGLGRLSQQLISLFTPLYKTLKKILNFITSLRIIRKPSE